MAAAMDDLTTGYVYELALKLRNNFDSLIQAHGSDPYEAMVPLIVRTLEQLECVTKQCDASKEEVEDLKFTIERLQADKKAKATEKEKYQKELELIEETWQNDARSQRDLITRLQEDNHRLNNIIKNKLGDVENIDKAVSREQELEEEMERMKEKCHRQREDLRVLEHELDEKTIFLDEIQSQLERSRKQNSEYKRKTSSGQTQVQSLIEDKSELEAQLHDRDVQIGRLKERLRRSNSYSTDDEHNAATATANNKPLSDEEFRKLVARLSLENKMVIDLNDANQPRFTLSDVSDVMNERNQLKQQLISLEEELMQYKPDFAKLEEGAIVFNNEEIDPPVQGPINKEPDEKLYPERYRVKGSGIRKLFRRFIDKIENSKLLKFNENSDDDDKSGD